jgi:hypothetical protein
MHASSAARRSRYSSVAIRRLGIRPAREPGLLPEAAHLVDDGDPQPVAQGEGQLRVDVVRRGLQNRRAELSAQRVELLQAAGHRVVEPGGKASAGAKRW